MAALPLDPETDAAVRRVMSQARRNGLDVVEALNAVGLILGKRQRRRVILAALQDLQSSMDAWTPAQYLRRVNKERAPTPKEMYDAILGYLNDYVEREAKESG